jgi:hypothetical protein
MHAEIESLIVPEYRQWAISSDRYDKEHNRKSKTDLLNVGVFEFHIKAKQFKADLLDWTQMWVLYRGKSKNRGW